MATIKHPTYVMTIMPCPTRYQMCCTADEVCVACGVLGKSGKRVEEFVVPSNSYRNAFCVSGRKSDGDGAPRANGWLPMLRLDYHDA